MRLSLRTLLAFEDNIFDAEHRFQLERMIPNHDNAVETLRRLRSIVRNPKLGVPGIVDHREELDPNLVAEYLDHQIAAEQLDKFETYCLSSDTYLAEVASVHQILSNVLGEPARTSRDCRLRCYDIGHPRSDLAMFGNHTQQKKTGPNCLQDDILTTNSQASVSREQSTQSSAPKQSTIAWLLILLLLIGLGSFLCWQKIHEEKKKSKADLSHQIIQIPVEQEPPKQEPSKQEPSKQEPPKQEPPKQEPPKQEPLKQEPPKQEPPKQAPPKQEPPKQEPLKQEPPKQEPPKQEPPKQEPPKQEPPKQEPPKQEPPKQEPPKQEPPKQEPPKQEPPKPAVASSVPLEDVGAIPTDPFLNSASPPATASSAGSDVEKKKAEQSQNSSPFPWAAAGISEIQETNNMWNVGSGTKMNPLREDEQVSVKGSSLLFDGIAGVTEPSPEVHHPSSTVKHPEPIADAPLPIEFPERPKVAEHSTVPSAPMVWKTTAATPSAEIVQTQDMWEKPNPVRYPVPKYSEIRSTSYEMQSPATSDQTLTAVTFGEKTPFVAGQGQKPVGVPHNLAGKLIDSSESAVWFSAPSANEQWRKGSEKAMLQVDQYILTLSPFRVNLELDGKFRVELVGDAKICLLPLDAQGNPGIFIDYGRIVIRPLSNQPKALRIQTEKTSGLATLGGRSLMFVDTFAEIIPTMPEPNIPLANATVKNNAILGLLPDPADAISWQTEDQERPYKTNAQTSVLLEKGRSDRGAIRNLPNWLQAVPLSEEGKMFVTITERAFEEAHGNCEAALERISRNPLIPVRAFGHRLWGDLGRFDVPLQLLARNTSEDEPVRQILAGYFREVMKRDAETVQRLADAIDTVRR